MEKIKEVEIAYYGIPLRIIGYYQPEEKEVLYYPDGSGHPGCSSSFDINEVYASDSDIDIFEIISRQDMIKINELVIEKIEE
jgi:hypothetical protein